MTSALPVSSSPPAPAAGRTRAPTILLLNPSGWGNLGDAAILDSTIQAIRSRWPGSRIIGVTLSPADTEERHGIEGFLLAGRSLSGYGMIGRPDHGEHPLDTDLPGMSRLARLPLLSRPVRMVNDAMLTLLAEPGHSRSAARLVAQSELVIAAGGGQLDEFWGGPWGHPFALYKWGRLARRARVPFALLSVGMCELETRLARRFIRGALDLASYHSFRDKVSGRRAEALGLRRPARVVPDLAYGLALPAVPKPVGSSRHRRVGVSPIAYRDPRSWPGGDAGFFRGYVAMLAGFVHGLLADGCEVSLFATDWCDWAVVDDVRAALSPADREAVIVADTRTVPDLFKHIGELDLVVASRLHGLLLAQRAGRPTLALSYDRKVDTLMADMGFSHFCLSLDSATLDQARSAYRAIVPDLTLVQLQVQRRVQEYVARVSAQFEEILGTEGLLSRP